MKAPLQITAPRLLATAPLARRVGLRFCRLLAPPPRPSPLAASRPRLSTRSRRGDAIQSPQKQRHAAADLGDLVPQGTRENSPRLKPWVSGRIRKKPRTGQRNLERRASFLSSLTELSPYTNLPPAINRWGICDRPCGTPLRAWCIVRWQALIPWIPEPRDLDCYRISKPPRPSADLWHSGCDRECNSLEPSVNRSVGR